MLIDFTNLIIDLLKSVVINKQIRTIHGHSQFSKLVSKGALTKVERFRGPPTFDWVSALHVLG